jgi:predicted NBD/HSP70 family sugar kinase
MTTLAIDIGGTKLAAALVDGDLQIHQRRESPASKTPDALRAHSWRWSPRLFLRPGRWRLPQPDYS